MKSDSVGHVIVAIGIFLLALVGRSVAFSYEYHPLAVGSHWEYYSTLHGAQSSSIVGEEVVLGVITRVRRQVQPDQVWENFWSSDSAGNLYLHGGRNFTYPVEVAYAPPIKMVAAPLLLGKVWVTPGVRFCDLDGTPWEGDSFDFAFQVYTEGRLTVPAGEFYAYGVGPDTGPGLMFTTRQGTFDMFLQWVGDSQLTAGNATEWYADGVGVVQQCNDTNTEYAFHLLSYWLPPVSTQPTTWGRLKAMFGRDGATR